MFSLGIDVGSVYVGLVALDEEGDQVFTQYLRHHGTPETTLRTALEKLDPGSVV